MNLKIYFLCNYISVAGYYVGMKKIIRRFEQLKPDVLSLIKKAYPDGYEENLISFQSPRGELELALPLETEEVSYLIKMPKHSLPDDEDFESDSGDEKASEEFESLEVAKDIADE